MAATITDGMRVSVESTYQADFSNPLIGIFLFAYKVTIENLTNAPMKLLYQQWEIFDEVAYHIEEYQGIAGTQPTIASGESYNYVSSYLFHSEMGKMEGAYLFKNVSTNRMHEIKIPSFELMAPFKNN